MVSLTYPAWETNVFLCIKYSMLAFWFLKPTSEESEFPSVGSRSHPTHKTRSCAWQDLDCHLPCVTPSRPCISRAGGRVSHRVPASIKSLWFRDSVCFLFFPLHQLALGVTLGRRGFVSLDSSFECWPGMTDYICGVPHSLIIFGGFMNRLVSLLY